MWKHLEGEYPHIVAIARDILSMPDAGAGVERVFSIARHQERFNRSYSPKVFSNMMMARLRLSAGDRSVLDEIQREDEIGDVSFLSQSDLEEEHEDRLREIEALKDFECISDDDEVSIRVRPVVGRLPSTKRTALPSLVQPPSKRLRSRSKSPNIYNSPV
jgi:hypothetical protein